MKDALEGASPERENKVQAAVGQSPPPSMAQANALPPLTRALISKPPTEPIPIVQQLSGMAHSFQEPPPAAKQLSGKVQRFQEVDSDLAKKQQE